MPSSMATAPTCTAPPRDGKGGGTSSTRPASGGSVLSTKLPSQLSSITRIRSSNGGWVASAEGVRLLAFDLKVDYAFYLKVQIDSADVQSPDELAALAGSLLDDLLGEIMTCAPDWTKVERGLWPPDNPRGPQTAAPPQP